jgi:hypothetical protein
MMVLDFIQTKLFPNYQPPKPFSAPAYRPPTASNGTGNNPQNGGGTGSGGATGSTNPFKLNLTLPTPALEIAGATPPMATLGAISGVARPSTVLSKAITGNNPFLLAQTDPAKQLDQLGKNLPFAKPIFLGYKDDKALYGGSKLFVLC